MTLPTIFLLILARVAAMMFTAPVFGSRSVGYLTRILLAVTVSLMAVPLVYQGGPVELESLTEIEPSQLIAALPGEIMTGALLGLGVMIIFSATTMAGGVIGQMSGIQISGQMDPGTGSSSTPVSRLFGILSLAVFVLVGGPELVVSAVLDTFAGLPVGAGLDLSAATALVVELCQQSFSLALRGVAPAVVAMLISTLVIGLIGRSYPQINMLNVGLQSNMLVMFLAVFLTLGGCVWLFVDDLPTAVNVIQDAIRAPETIQ